MCGICGEIRTDGVQVSVEAIRQMCQTLSYRGPDDQGGWTQHDDNGVSAGLGHRRLSVIDPTPAGRQPMANEDGTIRIVYNGEVYNYLEIRNELIAKGHTFRSQTDTETLLHLYEDAGMAAVDRLNGMFAFAIWDGRRSRLWLCRDRIGIKPLVYHANDSRIVFASEIKALLRDPGISREIDFDALRLYLAFGYIPAPFTIFKTIRKLPPGHSLTWERGHIQIDRYWDLPRQDLIHSEAEAIARLRDLVDDAVRRRMVADVPVGAFLSGGIDSGIVTALMARYATGPVKTFSIGFSDGDLFDETRYAQLVADRYGTDHHVFRIRASDMIDALPSVLETFDEPFSDSSAIPTFIVSRETREHVTVALSGDGGDELFAGYRSYLAEYWRRYYLTIPAIFRKPIIERQVERLRDGRDSRFSEYVRRIKKFIRASEGSFDRRAMALKEIIPKDVRKRLLTPSSMNEDDPARRWIQPYLRRYPDDPINALLYSDFADSLPGDMLAKVDWMSMKNSLEVRVPLLDHRVASLAFALPGPMKLRRGATKYLLKKAFADLLPERVLRRPKSGFEIPIGRWLRGELRFLVDHYLSPEKIRAQGMFDEQTVRRQTALHLAGKTDASWTLWNLIVFGYWFDHYGR